MIRKKKSFTSCNLNFYLAQVFVTGLIHMIGGLTRTATAALRQLLDAGTLASLPASLKQED